MTDDRNDDTRGGSGILPDELLAARDRIEQQRSRALRSMGLRRSRRRFLPAAIVSSAVLVTAGLADRFVQATVSTKTPAAASPPTSLPSSASARTLAQVSRALAADQRAIAQLAQAQVQLARRAGEDSGATTTPSISPPSLPSIPAVPNISIAAQAAPTTHATTGASIVVP